jgi:hypothetical protein
MKNRPLAVRFRHILLLDELHAGEFGAGLRGHQVAVASQHVATETIAEERGRHVTSNQATEAASCNAVRKATDRNNTFLERGPSSGTTCPCSLRP